MPSLPPPVPKWVLDKLKRQNERNKKAINIAQMPHQFMTNLFSSTFEETEVGHMNRIKIGKEYYDLIIIDGFTKDFLSKFNYEDDEITPKGFYVSMKKAIYIDHLFNCYQYEFAWVLYHEIFHAVQHQMYCESRTKWFDLYHNAYQTSLYQKWKTCFKGTYADTDPAEAAAEVFRAISGHKLNYMNLEWEKNLDLIEDYRNWFKTIPILGNIPFI